MKNIPLLSVCIPTYNSSAYLDETLQSLVSQFHDAEVYEQVEIVISDNASPDDTFSIVQKYQALYNNIHYTRNESNLGWAVNVIKVTEWAHSNHLWLLTDNDSSSKFALSYILRIIKETDFDVMVWNFEISTPEGLEVFHQDYAGYSIFKGISEFGDYLGNIKDMPLHVFWSNFSLYSIFFAKKSYFDAARKKLDQEKLKTHFFPHSLIIYSDIQDKIIVKPHNTFTLPMWHPSSWRHNARLFWDFREVFQTFMYLDTITKAFSLKIRRFLRGYWIINYFMYFIGPFPFIGESIKYVMKKSKLFKKLVDSVLNPNI